MFENLSENLGNVFGKLKKRGLVTESDVGAALREVRIALLEADVALPVAKEFIASIKEEAVGEKVIKSVKPAQMVVKIVNDHLVELLGSENAEINLNAVPPAVILMVGLQGSGKTTSCGKLAHHLTQKYNKKVLMSSLDVYRPAAQDQLAVLGKQINVDTVEIIPDQKPAEITKRTLKQGKLEGYDVIILDTAGRLHIDDELMQEVQAVKELSNPVETLLVADSLTGQDAVNVAKAFQEQVGLTGNILTRMDGDGRGGAALSMKMVTDCPIKFIGVGEKISELEPFHPKRIADRILDMGDVVSLVEKAAEVVDEQEAEKLAKKMKKGTFDLDDLAKQLKTMRKMGGVGSLLGMMPGIGKMKQQLEDADVDDKMIIRQEAIISSMTPHERRFPKVLNASRKKRIAAGCGMTVQDVNRLLKQHKQMGMMMKKLGKMDKKSLMRSGLGGMLPPNMPS